MTASRRAASAGSHQTPMNDAAARDTRPPATIRSIWPRSERWGWVVTACGSDEAVLLCEQGQAEPSIELKLLVDVVEMHLDGSLRDGKTLGDRTIPETLSDHLHELDLARCQQLC